MFGAILGGIFGGLGQAKAAKESAKISREALAAQKAAQDKVWANAAPYMDAGRLALGRLQDPNAFVTSPGYQFRMAQGLGAVENSKAVNGLLRSGGAMKAISDYAQNTASDEYGKWVNQQLGVVSAGTAGLGAGAGVANSVQQAIGQDASNRANAGMAGANAWSGIAGQIGGAADLLMSSYGR